ncbi:MAG TPA: DUF4003 family protein [Acholeplasmataceae bacterium]|jgi:hypothetical protein|nr:DUF4003 family protein [Acholeplasmataceae bacterium]
MDSDIQTIVQAFHENSLALKKPLENEYFKRTAALLYALNGRKIDLERIRFYYDLIKRKTGWLSAFRWNYHLFLSAMLALEDEGEKKFAEVLATYQDLKNEGFSPNPYLVLTSWFIVKKSEEGSRGFLLKKTRLVYEGMKNYHRFLTSPRYCLMAAVFGTSEIDYALLLKKAEKHYQNLKKEFSPGWRLLETSHALCVYEDYFDPEKKLLSLKDLLNRKGIKIHRGQGLPFLGLLATLPADPETIAGQVEKAYLGLLEYKTFRSILVPKQEMLMYACTIVAWTYAEMDPQLSVNLKDLAFARLLQSISLMSAENRQSNE